MPFAHQVCVERRRQSRVGFLEGLAHFCLYFSRLSDKGVLRLLTLNDPSGFSVLVML